MTPIPFRNALAGRLADEAELVELAVGPNPYSRFLRARRRYPNPAEARTMAAALGIRLRASNGRLYPMAGKAEVDERRAERDKQRARARWLNLFAGAAMPFGPNDPCWRGGLANDNRRGPW